MPNMEKVVKKKALLFLDFSTRTAREINRAARHGKDL